MAHTFLTPLSNSECSRVFAGSVAVDRDPLPDGDEPYLGRVEDTEFSLRARTTRRISFAPVFYGSFQDHANGTLIEGRFGLEPSARAFMLIWFAFAAIAIFALACALASTLSPALSGAGSGLASAEGGVVHQLLTRALWVLLVPLAAASVWLYWRLQARDEKDRILEFLQTTLDAYASEAVEGEGEK
jgi:hypothetical protein